MPGAYLGPRPTNTRQGSFDAGKAASGAGSFIANELLGIDDMKNAVKHAKEGDWAGVGRSALAIGAELGGTLAAGAAIGLSGGAAAPGVAALYAGKVAAKKGAKEIAEVGIEQTMKNSEKIAADSILKRAGAEAIENKVLKSEARDYKAQAKEAWDIHKKTTTGMIERRNISKGYDEINKMTGGKKSPGTGTGKGSGKYGDVQGGSKLPGSGSGGSPAGGSGGVGGRGSLGSEGGGFGGGSGSTGPSGGGVGTLTKPGQQTSTQFTRGGRGGPEGEPISRPKVEKPKTPTNLTRPGGTSGQVGQEQVIKVGTETSIAKPFAATPDAASSIISGNQLILNTGAAAGLGLSNALQNQLQQSTPISTPTTTTTNSSGGGGGGNNKSKRPDLDGGMGVGEQNVKLQRVY